MNITILALAGFGALCLIGLVAFAVFVFIERLRIEGEELSSKKSS